MKMRRGADEIRTRVTGFKVQGANHCGHVIEMQSIGETCMKTTDLHYRNNERQQCCIFQILILYSVVDDSKIVTFTLSTVNY